MKDKTDQTIPLEAAKVEFLEQMVQAHGLSDIGKAVRCLIDYARENPDQQAVIFEKCAASTARTGQGAPPKRLLHEPRTAMVRLQRIPGQKPGLQPFCWCWWPQPPTLP